MNRKSAKLWKKNGGLGVGTMMMKKWAPLSKWRLRFWGGRGV